MRPRELRRRTWVHAALALAAANGRPAARQEQIGKLTLAEAARCFAQFEEACARDGGQLWKRPIAGPVLLVDPVTRKIVGNRPDAEGKLEAKEGVFVGTLPRDKPIANAPLDWAGVHWAMALVVFLGESPAERVTLLAHESFHLLEPELGLYVFGEENEHLATAEGRLWLQLEWDALEVALAAEGEERSSATRDALDFRAARRARFPEAATREAKLELREGLASYTGLRIAGRGPAEVAADVRARRAKEEEFVRSFAYSSGPLYGYLLDAAHASWRGELTGESDLGALLSTALALAPSAERAATRAAAYGGDELRALETERERARAAQLAEWRAALVEGPVLLLDLGLVASRTVDTRRVFPLDKGRTVYTERKLVGRFGTLEVHGGALLEDAAARQARVTLQGAAEDRSSGPGWTLTLAAGWRIVPGERAGDFVVRQAP